MEILFDILKLVAAVGGVVFGVVKWLLERGKKDKLAEMYERILTEKDKRILELEKKKKKLEKLVSK